MSDFDRLSVSVALESGMHFLRLFSLVGLCASLAACASLQQPKSAQTLAQLRSMGIDNRTYAKIVNQRVLSYDDIYGLVQKSVPGAVIVSYLKSTHAPYTLTNAQLERLTDAGASADLVNYLGKSVGYFEATERNQTGGAGKWKNDPYFADPYFMGEPPFAYGWDGPGFGLY